MGGDIHSHSNPILSSSDCLSTFVSFRQPLLKSTDHNALGCEVSISDIQKVNTQGWNLPIPGSQELQIPLITMKMSILQQMMGNSQGYMDGQAIQSYALFICMSIYQ